MTTFESTGLVPANTQGKQSDVEESVTAATDVEASKLYRRAVARMLNVGIWHKLSGLLSAHFKLQNEDGAIADRLAKKGDYFRIDVPGPGPASGDGYDWVQVEALENHSDEHAEEEFTGLRVRSCRNPHGTSADVAHFFTSDATSTFLIRRKSKTVIASYHGRNEIVNTHTKKLTDKIRNAVAGVGALAGVSELQWGRLVKSFLEEEV